MRNVNGIRGYLTPAAIVAFATAFVSPAPAEMSPGAGLARRAMSAQTITEVRFVARHNTRRARPIETAPEDPPPVGVTGEALAACDKGIGKSEILSLPGTKGEIKLDQCYRGREQLVCSLAALSLQSKALVQDFARIVEANYPDVANVDSICGMAPENLAAHMEKASTFAARFAELRAEYDRRLTCVARVEQSLQQVSLADMPRSDEILKSINATLEGDIKEVAITRQRLIDLAESMDASKKAIAVIQRIHRSMCFAQPQEQPTNATAQDKPVVAQPAAPAPQVAPMKK
jgi:hypothetical protein